MDMEIYVQVPSFEEGDDMLPALRSITEQRVPDDWTVHRECWVTLSPKDKELCTTWQAALKAEGFEPYEAPDGKLETRNTAHDHAAENGADAIVTWDADCVAHHDEVLYNLCQHFEDPSVAAVRGEPISPWTDVTGALENVKRLSTRAVTRHMHGQLSAFTADAWRHAGPFDTDRDQTSLIDVWMEEEYAFARRLREAGRMVHESDAAVQDDSRRTKCKISRSLQRTGRKPVFGYCESRGETTFAPRGDCGCDSCRDR